MIGSGNTYMGYNLALDDDVPEADRTEDYMVRIGFRIDSTISDKDTELMVGKSAPNGTGNFLSINGDLRLKSPDGRWWKVFVNNSGKVKTASIDDGEQYSS